MAAAIQSTVAVVTRDRVAVDAMHVGAAIGRELFIESDRSLNQTTQSQTHLYIRRRVAVRDNSNVIVQILILFGRAYFSILMNPKSI